MEHEYSVLGGLNRAAIGRYITLVSAAAASGIGVLVLYLFDVAKRFGWAENLPPLILWPLTGGLIYLALYWYFSTRVWRWKRVVALLRVPDLAGTWHVSGLTRSEGGRAWSGEIVIVQSWDKLRVRLRTAQSTSSSIAAALVHDQADGYRLLYNYRNEPKIGEPGLASHRGSADLLFDSELQSATGEYFNGHGRFTFGEMKLSRAK